MSSFSVPTSKDIYIEAAGSRLGVVESYTAKASRNTRVIEALGEELPVAVIGGRISYDIELSRLDTTPAHNDGIDFFELDDFNLVVVKSDCRIVYSGCKWKSISETVDLGEPIVEKVGLIATKRLVIS